MHFEPGDYGREGDIWYVRCPDERLHLADISAHTVTEHADGTITVFPSILINAGQGVSWHGYLEKGVWRSV